MVLKLINLSFVGAKPKFLAETIQSQNLVLIKKLTPNRFFALVLEGLVKVAME